MDQFELIKNMVDAFESLNINYFITGSIASIFYGEPRFTNDIDIVAEVETGHVNELLKLFSVKDYYLSADAIHGAIKSKQMFNIIHPASGLKVDVMISKNSDFDQSRFSRIRKCLTVKETKVNFSSPEDVIIMKMKYYKDGGSEKHLRDITGMLKISKEIIDINYIEKWVNNLNLNEIWKGIQDCL